MKWAKASIVTPRGAVDGIAPEVISASRSTDVPAFHAEWFMARLRAGYVRWVNPFNRQEQFISLERVKAIVFWSKNPAPLIKHLPEIDARGIRYYFQFTLNDYEEEHYEPNVPALADRIGTFRRLSEALGRERVIWRFDPLILTDRLDAERLLRKVKAVGDAISDYTSRLVFSFVDVAQYTKVERNLRSAGINWREFSPSDVAVLAEGVASLCREWGIMPMACGEEADLSGFGIARSACVDDCLLLRITHGDPALRRLFGYTAGDQIELLPSDPSEHVHAKDPGQRPECNCVLSKDVGQYNTCPHLCVYCYANASPHLVRRNLDGRTVDSESIVGERSRPSASSCDARDE